MKHTYYISIMFTILIMISFSCKKEEVIEQEKPIIEEPSDITTEPVTYDKDLLISLEIDCIGYDKVVADMSAYTSSSYDVTEKGICYSLNPEPTTSNNKIDNNNSTNLYEYTAYVMSSLNSATIYYVRAYAINEFGTFYSDEISVTTNTSPPTLSIGDIYQGGRIAELNCDGTHGLIVAMIHNQSTYTHIVAVQECNDYIGGGHFDWKMPSVRQMRSVYNNLFLTGLMTNFDTNTSIYAAYWTSSPAGSSFNEEFYQYFSIGLGTSNTASEFYNIHVRPVRTF